MRKIAAGLTAYTILQKAMTNVLLNKYFSGKEIHNLEDSTNFLQPGVASPVLYQLTRNLKSQIIVFFSIIFMLFHYELASWHKIWNCGHSNMQIAKGKKHVNGSHVEDIVFLTSENTKEA